MRPDDDGLCAINENFLDLAEDSREAGSRERACKHEYRNNLIARVSVNKNKNKKMRKARISSIFRPSSGKVEGASEKNRRCDAGAPTPTPNCPETGPKNLYRYNFIKVKRKFNSPKLQRCRDPADRTRSVAQRDRLSLCKSIPTFFARRTDTARRARARAGMRLFPVAFLASDSNARGLASSRMNDRRGDVDTPVVDLLTSCRRRQRRHDGRVTTVRPLCDRLAHDNYRQKTSNVCTCICVAERSSYQSRRTLRCPFASHFAQFYRVARCLETREREREARRFPSLRFATFGISTTFDTCAQRILTKDVMRLQSRIKLQTTIESRLSK